MRKTKPLTLLLSGVVVAAAAVTEGCCSPPDGHPSYGGRCSTLPPPAEASQAMATSTALTTCSASPIPQGAPLMMTATVTPAAAAGTVQFQDGGANIGDPVIVSQWQRDADDVDVDCRVAPAQRRVHAHRPGALRPVDIASGALRDLWGDRHQRHGEHVRGLARDAGQRADANRDG